MIPRLSKFVQRGLPSIAMAAALCFPTILAGQDAPFALLGARSYYRVSVLQPVIAGTICAGNELVSADSLAAALATALNGHGYARINATALPSSIPDTALLTKGSASDERALGYWLESELGIKDRIPTVDVRVRSETLRTVATLSFRARDAGLMCKTMLNELVHDVAEGVAVSLARRIRIAVLDFPMQGGDSTYAYLARAIPGMLSTGLAGSSRLTLVESMDRRNLNQRLGEAIAPQVGIHDVHTASRIGRVLVANYLVMGHYWELDSAVRIDVRVVNIETSQVVASRGVNISPIHVSNLDDRLTALANQIRSAIETDFQEQGDRPRYVAVAARPPVPVTRDNRRMLEEMIRSLSRKLQHMDGRFRMRESTNGLDFYLGERTDRWQMSGALSADVLLTLQLDRSDPDHLILEYDLFAPEQPDDLLTFPPVSVHVDRVDDALTAVADSVLQKLGERTTTRADRLKATAARYRGIHRGLGAVVRAGYGIRQDDVFLGTETAASVGVGIDWILERSGRFHLEPFNIRLTYPTSSFRRKVYGTDVLAQLTYRYRPNHARRFYAGVATGCLCFVRKGPAGDLNYDGVFSVGGLAGIEQRVSRVRLLYEVTYLRGMSRVTPKTLDGAVFPGGRLGGLLVSLGITSF